uniref:Uncharacterized protein n=1 Tax=Chromera velia CCMP2878 TaxID=1169474 RepID=A0A0G4GEH5_9ALVE|eukprot:Cvel_4560.t1-p1 / transcript=Cvel_4560.t1 / gene=Cvel_4560 / organism=Chromera_velia_CCMP2878 / gene_product=hypothetical protein / transcript_product=hypothetical protein / location=Cvel_scaffold200:30113-30817(+) / protein_length=235 / sequence_SO=supercontig / SO=protein_coding / is_pseudo=false
MIIGITKSGAVDDKEFTAKIDCAAEMAEKYAATGTDQEKLTKKIAKLNFWIELANSIKDGAAKRTSQAESVIQSFSRYIKKLIKKKKIKNVADIVSTFRTKWQEHKTAKGTVSEEVASRRLRKSLPRSVRSSLAISLTATEIKLIQNVLDKLKTYTAEAGLSSDDSDLELFGSSSSDSSDDEKRRRQKNRSWGGTNRNDFAFGARRAETDTEKPRFTRVSPSVSSDRLCPLCTET